jgi:hypothetical protein
MADRTSASVPPMFPSHPLRRSVVSMLFGEWGYFCHLAEAEFWTLCRGHVRGLTNASFSPLRLPSSSLLDALRFATPAPEQ